MRRGETAVVAGLALLVVVGLPLGNVLPSDSPLHVSDFTLNLLGKFLAYAILALGLRNPWRFSRDRRRPERIVIGDVGHSRTEEVNAGSLDALRGANFGWPCYEGRSKLAGCKVRRHRGPAYTYAHAGGRCSITGGYVNRAKGLPRQGEYFYGDFCTGEIRTVDLRRRRSHATGLRVPSLVSFGQDAGGRLYTVSLNGDVRRIVNR